MVKKSKPIVGNNTPLLRDEKIHAVFLGLNTTNFLLSPEGFERNFIAFICFLGATITVFWLLRQNQGSKIWHLVLFAIYVFCCFSAIVFMLVDVKAMETIANFLATFQ